MVCDDRQLTQAQREAAFEALRNAGSVQAIRPFSGKATPENLVDYLNREVFPVLKQTRKAVNDVYRPVLDNAPSANPLTYIFAAPTGSGAWDFDGIDDSVSIGNIAALDPTATTPFTASVWFTTTSGAAMQLFGKEESVAQARGWGIVMPAGGTLYFILRSTAALKAEAQSVGTYNDGAEHHVVFAHSGSGTVAGFSVRVDGVLLSLVTIQDNLGGNTTTSAAIASIGSRNGTVIPFDGILRHVAFWNSALSAAQQLEVYSGGTPPDLNALPTAPDPLFWAKLDATDATGAGGVFDHGTGGNAGTAQGGLGPSGGTLSSADGRLYVSGSPQSGSTTIRLSELNGRLQDVAPWMSVMDGSASAPLGVVTLSHARDPSRFVRFDLNSVVDSGTYWDLTVVPLEASHPDPFVDGDDVVVSFIAGVASGGATIPPGSITPIADDTFLANISGASASPSEVALTTLAGAGLTGGGDAILAVGSSTSIVVNANDVQRAALTGDVTAAVNSNTTAIAAGVIVDGDVNGSAAIAQTKLGATTGFSVKASGSAATTSAEPIVTYSASATMSAARVTTSSTSVAVNTSVASQIEFRRAAITGAVSAASNVNSTQFSGIRDNGSLETARGFINVLSTSTITALGTQDAGNDEIELTWSVNLTAAYAWTGIHSFTVAAGSGNQFTVDVNGDISMTAAAVGILSDSTILIDAVGDLTLASDGNVVVTGDALFVSGEGFIIVTGETGSTPSLTAGQGMFWALDPGSPATRPQYTDDGNVNREILTSGPVQNFTTGGLSSNVAISDATRILRVDTGATAWSIDGFAASTWDGRELIVYSASNSGTTGAFIHTTASASAAANQIVCAGNVSFGPTVRCCAHFVYDGTDSIWRMTATNSVA